MARPALLFSIVLAAIGGWIFFQDGPPPFQGAFPSLPGTARSVGWPSSPATNGPVANLPTRQSLPAPTPTLDPGMGQDRRTIRVATFNIQTFGATKLSKPNVMQALANIVRQFDVIAIQEIRSTNQDVIPTLVDIVNSAGAQYDFTVGPRLGRTSSKEQFAFVFDRRTLQMDRYQLYTLDDPDDLLHREPLVGWFRARGPEATDAFTFTLVTLHADPDDAYRENQVLGSILQAVRDDGRGEDDVIIAGDFNLKPKILGELLLSKDVVFAVQDVPTNTRLDGEYDNVLMSRQFTDEFTGRAGVWDFRRQWNMTLEQALEISDHLPVWAEFSIYEGGQQGRFANRVQGFGR